MVFKWNNIKWQRRRTAKTLTKVYQAEIELHNCLIRGSFQTDHVPHSLPLFIQQGNARSNFKVIVINSFVYSTPAHVPKTNTKLAQTVLPTLIKRYTL